MQKRACFLAIAVLAGPAGADVIEVTPGGLGKIQDAVDAAQPGDTVLVHAGSYSEGFVVDGKSLTVTADRGAVVRITHATVRNLAPDQSVLLRGMEASLGSETGLTIQSCAGAVLVEDGTFVGDVVVGPFHPGGPEAAGIFDSDRVTLVRCSFVGDVAHPELSNGGGPALVVEQGSTVHLFDCDAIGGAGLAWFPTAPSPGNVGLRVDGASFVYASGCSIEGGVGSTGWVVSMACSAGGDGGAGLVVADGASEVLLLDTPVAGGAGGPGGLASCASGVDAPAVIAPPGTVVALPGAARRMAIAHPLREHEPIVFDLVGEPGDLAFLGLSHAQAPLYQAALLGPLVPSQPVAFVVPLGALPAGGSAWVTAQLGAIAGQDELFFGQLLVFTTSLEPRLGTAQSIVLLDEAF